MSVASLRIEGDRLCLTGTLDRDAATLLWPQVAAVAPQVHVLDLTTVEAIDSAGLALLVAVAGNRAGVRVDGTPPGLADLRAAYRLTPALAFDDGH